MALDDFEWAGAPLSSVYTVAAASLTYVVVAVAAKAYFTGGPKVPSDSPSTGLAVHNAILCLASAAMSIGAAVEVYKRYHLESNLDFFFCEREETVARGALFFWAYMYYLSKYYELLDTALAFICRGSSPKFFAMHVYHHGCVLWMAWAYLEHRQSLAFGGLIANTATHVVMYAYYARSALKMKTWWKNWVTTTQIVQFISSFVLLAISVSYAVSRPCAGTKALAGNAAFNASLLYMFFGVLATNTVPRPKKK
ncbi:ELO family [Pelagophyceae sp. CCMP2097]|nr:ELO family [Pelagophyceae sp. CCMP2097]